MLDSCEQNYKWAPRILKQGMLVQFTDPNAEAPEPQGRQTGFVFSATSFNEGGGGQVIVCPLVAANHKDPYLTAINDMLGVRLPSGILETKEDRFFRPDFIKSMAPPFVALEPLGADLRPAAKPEDIVAVSRAVIDEALKKLMGLISPDSGGRKLRENGEWGYGCFGWFDKFPYDDAARTAEAPAIILTPQSIWKRTGVALAARCHTNVTKFSPRQCIHIAPNGFNEGFINVSSLRSVNPEKRQSSRSGRPSVQFDRKFMEEAALKIGSLFNEPIYEEVKNKFPGKTGQLCQNPYTGIRRPSFR